MSAKEGKYIQLFVDPDLHNRIRTMAAHYRLTIPGLVISATRGALDRMEQEVAKEWADKDGDRPTVAPLSADDADDLAVAEVAR